MSENLMEKIYACESVDHSRARIMCEADPWLRRLGLPYYTLATLRNMHVGDELVLFDYDGPSMAEGMSPSRAGASIERQRGGEWHFSALWMLHVGNARKRGHIVTFGTFRLEKGRKLSLKSEDLAAWKSFARVVRLSSRLARMAHHAGDRPSSMEMQPYPWREHCGSDEVVPFLTTIAAPQLGGLTARVSA